MVGALFCGGVLLWAVEWDTCFWCSGCCCERGDGFKGWEKLRDVETISITQYAVLTQFFIRLMQSTIGREIFGIYVNLQEYSHSHHNVTPLGPASTSVVRIFSDG